MEIKLTIHMNKGNNRLAHIIKIQFAKKVLLGLLAIN